jgi:hypothetical protein
MPTAPALPTSGLVSGTSTGALNNWYTLNGVANAIYKATVGTTRTAAYTLTQANSGEVIPVNSASSVAITVPVLEVGTTVELVRLGAGAVTLTESGTTLVVPTGATATPRVTGSSISLLWLTTTTVLVGGDLT